MAPPLAVSYVHCTSIQQQVKTLVSCIQTLCAPHGTLILADPLRKHLQNAISQLEACGFTCHTSVREDTVILTAHPPDIT